MHGLPALHEGVSDEPGCPCYGAERLHGKRRVHSVRDVHRRLPGTRQALLFQRGGVDNVAVPQAPVDEIRVKGYLDSPHWSEWFDGLTVTLFSGRTRRELGETGVCQNLCA